MSKEQTFFDQSNSPLDSPRDKNVNTGSLKLAKVFYMLGGTLGLVFFGFFVSTLLSNSLHVAYVFGTVGCILFFLSYRLVKNTQVFKEEGINLICYLGAYIYLALSYLIINQEYYSGQNIVIPALILSLITWVLFTNKDILFLSLIAFYLAVLFNLIFEDLELFLALFLLFLLGMTLLLGFLQITQPDMHLWLKQRVRVLYKSNFYFALFTSFVLSVDLLSSQMSFSEPINIMIYVFYLLLNVLTLIYICKVSKAASYLFFIVFGIVSSCSILAFNYFGYYNFAICYLLILWSYLLNNKTHYILCALALLFNIVIYYYNLEITLLYKSVILMGTGLLLGVIFLVFKNKLYYESK